MKYDEEREERFSQVMSLSRQLEKDTEYKWKYGLDWNMVSSSIVTSIKAE